nr:MAG TPA: hypothetical protein [Caudoviricetes sp.]DAG20253.1 MAG TPA: hypothetical protein [Caudoviricetes sp.]
MSNNEIKPSESGGENAQYATANIGGVRATRKQAKEWVQASLKEMPDLLVQYAREPEELTLLLEARAALLYLDDLLIATAALGGMYD